MLNQELLQKIGFDAGDIPYILDCFQKYGPALAPLGEHYTATLGASELAPYPGEERENAYTRAKNYVAAAIALFPEEENPYILNLLSWLQLIPYLFARYKAHGLPEEMLFTSLSDLPEKVKECKQVYGVCGVFSQWFFLFFDLKVFSIGRLYYEVTGFEADTYALGNQVLRRGDPVLSLHINANGKLTPQACMDSLRLAHTFFLNHFPGPLPVVCHSWLLYPPYCARVFPEGSNLQRFAQMFRILYSDQISQTFSDCWRVFGHMHQGSTENFPADNRLRRAFLSYMEQGGDHGSGYGIFFYDSQHHQILS